MRRSSSSSSSIPRRLNTKALRACLCLRLCLRLRLRLCWVARSCLWLLRRGVASLGWHACGGAIDLRKGRRKKSRWRCPLLGPPPNPKSKCLFPRLASSRDLRAKFQILVCASVSLLLICRVRRGPDRGRAEPGAQVRGRAAVIPIRCRGSRCRLATRVGAALRDLTE